ncbi:hypothetical protein HanHA300_Chr00c0304g0741871 [Helianthus annuus]|nr:hypothetical protein HanHA89_Chr09g0345431 [Helianthus annuus]KAJ0630357.1 hypothetical protein HanHA300_Chr00c0304g0741871 [Helianthus annuus]KAJ0708003.1 hypothetical protein HanLR1_Chr09g0324761 [Helianthus annuus]KAJ0711972.1 hypothetical protein HanOQP8_Chr09g0329801 [Helianthus annuus]
MTQHLINSVNYGKQRRDMSDSFNNRNGGFKEVLVQIVLLYIIKQEFLTYCEAPTRFREVTNICLTTYGDTTHEHKDI